VRNVIRLERSFCWTCSEGEKKEKIARVSAIALRSFVDRLVEAIRHWRQAVIT